MSVNEDSNCTDVSNDAFNKLNNCTTITINQFLTFDRTAYSLYRLTFGSSLDEVKTFNFEAKLTNI